jgi:TorA maturation chaperone TorD
MAGRWELLRALGAVADNPEDARTASAALGLPSPGPAEHTEVFVLNCPPSASVYLGPAGSLGGEGADRVAGFWRAIGLTPPAEPDHLAALLGLYACLGEAADGTRRAATTDALTRARAALLWEHLWPWLPGYLDAVSDLATPALPAWASLTGQVLAAELAALPAGGRLPPAKGRLPSAGGRPSLADGRPSSARDRLPLALRAAPPALTVGCQLSDLLAAVVAPARSGIILTRGRLAQGADRAGVGHRIGERRFTLRAMIEQDASATLGWLGREAQRWSGRHARRAGGDVASQWWSRRASQTAGVLRDAAAAAGGGVDDRVPAGSATEAAVRVPAG